MNQPNRELVERLNQALEARPFDHLGVFETDAGWLIRVYQPDAEQLDANDLASGKTLGTFSRWTKSDVFELTIKQKKRPAYTLHIQGKDDHEWDVVDAYQCIERTFEDIPCDSATLYKTMGAQLCSTTLNGIEVQGVRFAVYAPNARSASVIGDFNNWDGRRHPMTSHHDGVWRLFVPHLQPGDAYKFELKDAREHKLPHKSDPYAFSSTQYPDFNSIVVDHQAYQWQDKAWLKRPVSEPCHEPMSIYELHAGSWKTHDGLPHNYHDLADQLIPYLLDMNFTHLELMPVSEYPYDGSWGYQPIGLFAPTSRFGTPDQFKYLVDQCHQNGIAVILDWVPAHFPADEHGLALFDGTHLYEYADPQRGWHPDWSSYIYDFGRYTVCDFLVSSALIWLEEFHIDGLRVDAVASMLYLDYSREEGEWTPNVDGGNHNYEAIAFIRRFNETVYGRFPRCYTIAEESTAFDGVSRPVFAGGLGFGFKWNMGWMHDTLSYMKQDPVHRKYHHDTLTFSAVYAFNENFVLPLSHDEVVHGKGTVMTRMPGDEWQQAANMRAYYSYMFAHPGKKLNFMGNEFGQILEWNYRAQLDWGLLQQPRHRGIQALFRDLNKLYRNEASLHETDCEVDGFGWINSGDSQASVISLFRKSLDGKELILVVVNFTPMPREGYVLGAPVPGNYEILLNSDSEYYGGSNFPTASILTTHSGQADGQPQHLKVTLPPLSALFLKLSE